MPVHAVREVGQLLHSRTHKKNKINEKCSEKRQALSGLAVVNEGTVGRIKLSLDVTSNPKISVLLIKNRIF